MCLYYQQHLWTLTMLVKIFSEHNPTCLSALPVARPRGSSCKWPLSDRKQRMVATAQLTMIMRLMKNTVWRHLSRLDTRGNRQWWNCKGKETETSLSNCCCLKNSDFSDAARLVMSDSLSRLFNWRQLTTKPGVNLSELFSLSLFHFIF